MRDTQLFNGRKLAAILAAIALEFSLSQPSIANLGYVSVSGGSPHLMKGGSTVSMVRESIAMDVFKNLVKVQCDFEFKNNGSACVVRMGFPDNRIDGHFNKPSFLSYESLVDKVTVPTELVSGDKPGCFWHVKDVKFGDHETRHLRESYTTVPGFTIVRLDRVGIGGANTVNYILHTGASWVGPVEDISVSIRFHDLGFAPRPVKMSYRKLNALPGTVMYRGPSVPEVHGNVLTFKTSKKRLSKKDDIVFLYNFESNGDDEEASPKNRSSSK